MLRHVGDITASRALQGVSVGIRGSILYVHKRNECIVPTLVLFKLISGPRDEIERKRVGACVIPKADKKFEPVITASANHI